MHLSIPQRPPQQANTIEYQALSLLLHEAPFSTVDGDRSAIESPTVYETRVGMDDTTRHTSLELFYTSKREMHTHTPKAGKQRSHALPTGHTYNYSNKTRVSRASEAVAK